MREPCWCHHCGCWSFRDEWQRWLEDGDTCPLCGDAHPGGGFDWDAVLTPGERPAAEQLAREHEEFYP